MSAAWRLGAIGGLQSLALLALIGLREWTLATGTLITLAVAPVDPRSLFQGDYVALAYEIGTFEASLVARGPDEPVPEGGQRLHVVLTPDPDPDTGPEALWRPLSAHPRRADADRAAAALEAPSVTATGTVAEVDRTCAPDQAPCPPRLSVRYGIESFFIPEGTGARWETALAAGTVTARIAVDAGGRAAIAALLIDGEVISDAGL